MLDHDCFDDAPGQDVCRLYVSIFEGCIELLQVRQESCSEGLVRHVVEASHRCPYISVADSGRLLLNVLEPAK